MKVMIESDPVRLGLAAAFQALQTIYYWDSKGKPVFDAFSEFEPDLFITGTKQLTRAHIKCILARPDLRVVVLIQDQYIPREVKEVQSIRIIHTPLAADITRFSIGNYNDSLVSDIVYAGDYGHHLDNYLIPLVKDYNVKVFGSGDWPIYCYLGQAQASTLKDAFRSAKICPYIPNTTGLNDYIYNVLSAGGFCISITPTIFNLVNDELVYVDSQQAFFEKVKYFINNPNDRLPYIRRAIESVYRNNTYYHRVAEILKFSGYIKEPKQALSMVPSQDRIYDYLNNIQ